MGPAVEAYCFDAALFSALWRLFRQLHELQSAEYGEEGTQHTSEFLWLTTLVVGTSCMLHKVQLCFGHGLREHFQDKGLLRDVHIGFASLIQSMNLFLIHLAHWISQRVGYHEPWDDATVESWMTLWLALGIKEERAELLARGLQLYWEGDKFYVVRGYETTDLVGVIRSMLLAMWKFAQFSDTRWLGAGFSGRACVVALLTGLHSCCEHVRRHSDTTLYYLKGFWRLQGEALLFLVVCAMVSRVPDAALLELMADPRLVQRREAIAAAVEAAELEHNMFSICC